MGIPQDEWVGAACRTPDPVDIQNYGWEGFMFPKGEGGRKTRLERYFIKKYCRSCPLLTFCKTQGEMEEFGIWGGEPEDSRRQTRQFLAFFMAA